MQEDDSGLTVKKMAEYFKTKITEIENTIVEAQKEKLNYPLLMVYLGDQSARIHKELSKDIFRNWRNYQDEILFMKIHDENLDTFESAWGNGKFQRNTLREIQTRLSKLSSVESHFANKNRYLMFFVLDAGGLESSKSLNSMLNMISAVQKTLGLDETVVIKTGVALLNEELVYHKSGKILKNYFGEHIGILPLKSIGLISNFKEDGSYVVPDQYSRECGRILSDIIAMVDSENAQIRSAVMRVPVYAVSWGVKDKPLDDIGQVLTVELIDFLSRNDGADNNVSSNDKSNAHQLGLSENGYFDVIYDYVDECAEKLFPSDEQIEQFPRRSDDDLTLSSLPARELDDNTMGAWSAYFDIVADSIKEQITKDDGVFKELCDKYLDAISKNFSSKKMDYYNIHFSEIEESIKKNLEHCGSIPENNLLEYEKKTISRVISGDDSVSKLFVEALREFFKNGSDFFKEWNRFKDSRNELFLEDNIGNVDSCYIPVVKTYLDKNSIQIMERFRKIRSSENLVEFMHSLIDDMILANDIFKVSFMEELKLRCSGQDSTETAKRVKEFLDKGCEYKYLSCTNSPSVAFCSSVFMKKGSNLQKMLSEQFGDNTFFCDTVSDTSIEIVRFYELKPENLVYDVEDEK